MQIASLVFIALTSLVPLALIGAEIRHWYYTNRTDSQATENALRRLTRRSLGCLMLLVMLVLLVFPPAAWLSPLAHAAKLLVCVGLGLMVILLSAVDLRAVRRELKQEIQKIQDRSARELLNLADSDRSAGSDSSNSQQ